MLHEGKPSTNSSSVYHSLKTVQPRVLLLTILTDGGTSLKNVWARKSRLMHLENNSRAMSLKLLVDMTETDLLWSKVFSPTLESDFSSSLDLKDTELRGQERERENQLEDALLVLISRCYLALLLKRERKKSLAWLIK